MSERLSEERTLCELYGLYEVFRRLGFTADEIYFVPEIVGPLGLTVGMAVQVPGHTFAASVDNGLLIPVDEWQTFATGLSSATQAELEALWNTATIGPQNALAIAQAMTRKGMTVPRFPELKKLEALRAN